MVLSPKEVVPRSDWVIFSAGIESLVTSIGDSMTDELRARFKAHGVDLSKKLQAAYPADAWQRCLEDTARHLFPTLTPDEAQRRVGQRFFDGWNGTITGRAAAAMLRLIGAQRAISRIGRVFRYGNNFTVTEATFDESGASLVHFLQTQQIPHFVRGVVESAMVFMNVNGSVTVHAVDAAGFTLRFQLTA
ncbi:MAG: DUF2378 family protein [Myxococcota bacterium]